MSKQKKTTSSVKNIPANVSKKDDSKEASLSRLQAQLLDPANESKKRQIQSIIDRLLIKDKKK